MATKINSHPFYQDPRFVTEKQILEKLTEICGFDDTVGIIDYFPKTPAIDIGFILEQSKEEQEVSVPILKKGSSIKIFLNSGSWLNPFTISEELSFEATRKILVPLVQHWLEVITFLVEFYGKEEKCDKLFLKTSLKSLEEWKKEFAS